VERALTTENAEPKDQKPPQPPEGDKKEAQPETPAQPASPAAPETGEQKLTTSLPQNLRGPETIVVGAGQTPLTPPPVPGQPLDIKAAYRRWLESKSKDELVDLIINIETQNPDIEITRKMIQAQASGQMTTPATYHIPETLTYLRLPVIRKQPKDSPHPLWKIVMVSVDQSYTPIGLEIDEEITIGRTTGEVFPDLDLTPYGATTKGVSRLHAMLRPTESGLTLIDNKSTNGTYVNKTRLTNPEGQPVMDGYILTFGKANFLLRVVSSPRAPSEKKGTVV
jgi:FHA domain-containing protein